MKNQDYQPVLRITEIFFSIQGESRTVGLPTVFVRLTGCPLRCDYCDTAYAFTGGEIMSIGAILAAVRRFPARHVTVTGGEPLAQKDCLALLTALCDAGYEVSLETSGALDVAAVDARVVKVLDLKTPASGEREKNRLANFAHLTPHDQIKFVVCDRADYDWAKAMIANHALIAKCELLLSPAWGRQDPAQLAEWILADGLPVRLQVQLHKILWGEARGR
jgi:7-carboxy-7-deazaguanine synthase